MGKGREYGILKHRGCIAIILISAVILFSALSANAVSESNKSLDNKPPRTLISLDKPILYERGTDWEDYLNPDGSRTRKIYTGLINYWNGSGYEPIDANVVEEGGSFKVDKGAYKVHWSNSKTFKLNKDSYYITYRWNGISQGTSTRTAGIIAEVKGQKNKNKLKFKEIHPSTDLEYIYYPDLLKENIILNRAPDMPVESETLDFSGYIEYSSELEIWANGAKQEGSFSTSGTIEFRAGETVEFTLPPPLIEDANNSQVQGEYEFIKENGKSLLSVKVPYEWLVDTDRVYPVVVDPSIKILATADTFVNQASPNTNYGLKPYLEVLSKSSSNERVLLRFYLTDPLPSGATISSATLWMNSYYADTGRTIDVWSMSDSPWDERTVTWNNQPSSVTKLSSNISGHGWRSWGVTGEVKSRWGKPLFLKVMDSAEGYSEYKFQRYYSWEYGSDPDIPYLEVIYSLPQNDCNIGSDASNTFYDANSTSTPKTCSGYLEFPDIIDYYKFSVTSGYTINVTLIPPSGADFDLYLYDSDYNQKAVSARGGSSTDSISYTADSSGEWRIEVFRYSGSGTYSLSVTVTQNDCGIGDDASNTFNGANSISIPKSCSGYLDSSDRNDYYRFYVGSGYTIDTSLTPPAGANFNLYLYSPDNILKAWSIRTGDSTESISYTADSSGEWRMEAYQYSGSGTYSFSVSADDKTPPAVSISLPASNSVLTSSTVEVRWSGSDSGSGINRYEVQLDSGGWINKGLQTSHNFYDVSPGTHTVYVKAVDNAANSATASVTFTVQQPLPDLSISGEDITFEKVG